MTNTKNINLGATDSVRAAARREDEKTERRQSRKCKDASIHVRNEELGRSRMYKIMKMERESLRIQRETFVAFQTVILSDQSLDTVG